MKLRSDCIVRAALVASVALAVSACGDDLLHAPCEAVSCDIGAASCRRAVFEATACFSGDPADEMPEVREMTRAEFREHLDAADEGDEIGPFDAAFQLMGLVPEDRSLSRAWADEEAAGWAAFYEYDSRSITMITDTVIGGADRVEALYVLSHEFVHALQHRRPGGDAFRGSDATSFDSYVARTSVIEGEANLHATRYLSEGLGYPIDWPALSEAQWEAFFRSVRSSSPLASSALFVPYAVGTDYVHSAWDASGLEAIDGLFRAAPVSVLDLMFDVFTPDDSRVEPLDCVPATGPPGYEPVASTSLGPVGLFAHRVANGIYPPFAWRQGEAWRADTLVVFESDDGDIAVSWRVRLRDSGTAEDLAASTDSSSAEPVRFGREVLLLYADDPTLLTNDLPWNGAAACGEPADLPISKARQIGRRWIGLHRPLP